MSNYRIVENEGQASITVFAEGGVRVASSEHPNWDAIVEAARRGEDPVELINGEVGIQRNFERVTDRVLFRDGVFYFDGDPVHDALTETVVRFWQAGEDDYLPLVKFFENVQTNPNEHTRENLYRWLQNQSFHINEDGNIVGYKGVNRAYRDPDDEQASPFVSISAGPAIVDGLEHTQGQVPNAPGSVIEMARSQVQHDPSVACSTGLHVGTWGYARDFSRDAVVAVVVNPRDVVSVPTDCGGQKMRCSRYTVIGEVTREHDKAAWDGVEVEEPEVEEDAFCEVCGHAFNEAGGDCENEECPESDLYVDPYDEEEDDFEVEHTFPTPQTGTVTKPEPKKRPWWRR